MSTPHNSAELGDFAKTCLLAGDPLRAKFIAETFLEDAKLVNGVRNVLGYTGYYKGKRVSVMGSGMGIPSIGIYAYELYQFYGVEQIIRIGSCGSYQEDVKVYDVILAQGACSDSNFAHQYIEPYQHYSAISDFDMLNRAYNYAKSRNMRVHVGNVLSADIFYNDRSEEWKTWANLNVLAVEMESYALFTLAARLHKKALSILTVSDSFVSDEITTPLERERKFTDMMEIALSLAE